ncbi:MAG: hypothetical protein LBS86_05850 [Treponema sp.]|jgi:hypothetical protein|nr:hypothetical protein [Treponema sp.]
MNISKVHVLCVVAFLGIVGSLSARPIRNQEIPDHLVSKVLQKQQVDSEIIDSGKDDAGDTYIVYKISPTVERRVTTHENGDIVIREEITAAESFKDAVKRYKNIFTRVVSYVRGGEEAVHEVDVGATVYKAYITIIGSRMITQEFALTEAGGIERQQCFYTQKYYQKCEAQLGPGWGFIARWDDIEGTNVADDDQNPAATVLEFDN